MVHGGKTMDGNAKSGGVGRMSRRRMAAWVAAALLLLLPLIAGAPWSVGDFILAGILLFGSLGAYEVAARISGDSAYRAAAGVAIAAAFLLIWVNAAVGITDSDADGLYLVVIAIGIIGAFIARFRPEGMALAMLAATVATAAVGVVALVAGIIPPQNSAIEILGLTAFFVVLFGGSAWMFWKAGSEGTNDA